MVDALPLVNQLIQKYLVPIFCTSYPVSQVANSLVLINQPNTNFSSFGVPYAFSLSSDNVSL